MKTLIKLSLVLASVTFFFTTAFSQTTRIKFKPGATSSIVTGGLTGYKDHRTYVIRVRRGQVLTTSNAGKNLITVEIEAPRGSAYEPDLAADCHDMHEVDPTAAGDYRITVTECRKGDRWRGKFKLRVRVR